MQQHAGGCRLIFPPSNRQKIETAVETAGVTTSGKRIHEQIQQPIRSRFNR